MGSLLTWKVKKAEVINDFFHTVFTNKCSNLTKLQKAKTGTGKMKNHTKKNEGPLKF